MFDRNEKKTVFVLDSEENYFPFYSEALSEQYDFEVFKCADEFGKIFGKYYPVHLVIADVSSCSSGVDHLFNVVKGKEAVPPEFILIAKDDDPAARDILFERGISDYMRKPFGKTELLKRVQRSLHEGPSASNADRIQIDQHFLKVTGRNGANVKLTHKELQILSTIAHSSDSAVARDSILKNVWQDTSVGKKTLDVHLFNLRRKLEPLELGIQFTPPNGFRLIDKPFN